MMKILFASDFHGNEQQMEALEQEADAFAPDVFVYLGDISPNRFMYDNPEVCDEYNQRVFFPLVRRLRAKRKYVMPGNTDFSANKKRYKQQFTDPAELEFVTEGVRKLSARVTMLFSSLTKISPHSLKDGETFDLDRPFVNRTTTRVVTQHVPQSDSAENVGRVRAGSIVGHVFDTRGVPSDLLEEHRKIEDRIQVQETRNEQCATVGAISYIGTTKSTDQFITSDALLYSARYFQRVDVLDSRTQPEWF